MSRVDLRPWPALPSPYLLWLLPVIAMCAVYAAYFWLIASYNANEISTFNRALTCQIGLSAPDCRDEAALQIGRTYMTGSGPGFELMTDDGPVSSILYPGAESQWRKWRRGDVVAVELWRGRVVTIAGFQTQDDPRTRPTASFFAAGELLGVVSLASAAGFAWLVLRPRVNTRQKSNLSTYSAAR